MSGKQLTRVTPDARATTPEGWERREKGPDNDFIVNCVVCCLVQACARPVELCFGKDERREEETSRLPKYKERKESKKLSQRLRMAVQRMESPSAKNSTNTGQCGPIAFIGDSDIEWWEPWHLTSW